MRKIEDDLGCRKRNSTNASKKTLEAPLVNKYRLILTFFIIGCLATILIAGVKDVYGAAGVSISPPRVDYGPVGVGSWEDQTITITNTGKLPFTVLEVPKWAPPNRPWLSLVADSCSNQELSSKGGFCSIAYRFSPQAVGDYDYQLNIQYTYDLKTVNNVNVHMEGTGIKGTPNITWSNPAPITYGTALGPTQLNATASVPGSFTYTPPQEHSLMRAIISRYQLHLHPPIRLTTIPPRRPYLSMS